MCTHEGAFPTAPQPRNEDCDPAQEVEPLDKEPSGVVAEGMAPGRRSPLPSSAGDATLRGAGPPRTALAELVKPGLREWI